MTSSATTLAVLLVCFIAVAVQGFKLRGGLFSQECPSDAAARLDSSLTKLQNIAMLQPVPENCGSAQQALQEARGLLRACFNSEDPSILKVLGRHDLSAYISTVQPLCFSGFGK